VRRFSAFLSVTLASVSFWVIPCGNAIAGDTQIYRSVDAQGNVTYTDHAPNANAPPTTVRYHEPTAQDLERVEQQRRATETAENQRLQAAINDNATQAQQQHSQQAQETRCDNARRQLAAVKSAARLYTIDAQGERVFMTDQEADARRAQARDAVSAACGS
jgi:hypothetical protein